MRGVGARHTRRAQRSVATSKADVKTSFEGKMTGRVRGRVAAPSDRTGEERHAFTQGPDAGVAPADAEDGGEGGGHGEERR